MESISVDQSFAVSSGLLDLVIVLGNDVKKHSLDRERQKGRWRLGRIRITSTEALHHRGLIH